MPKPLFKGPTRKAKPKAKKQKKIPHTLESQIRIPRPTGITELNKINNNPNINKLIISKYITHYINNNFTICGVPYTVEQLSNNLHITLLECQKEIYKQGARMGEIFGLNDMEKSLRALIFQVSKNCLEDRAQIGQQLGLLSHAQGGQYKPFISSTFNHALGLNLAANKNIMDLIKTLNPTSGPNILIQNLNQSQGGLNGKMITITEALNIIENKGLNPTAYTLEGQQQLSLPNPSSFPEVIATNQAKVLTDGSDLFKDHTDRRSLTEGFIDNDEI